MRIWKIAALAVLALSSVAAVRGDEIELEKCIKHSVRSMRTTFRRR
jgi:hypothetical protein